MAHFRLSAFIQCRKIKTGVSVTARISCEKFKGGAQTYRQKFVHIGDVDHWIARLVVEKCSEAQDLNLSAALRALEVRHVAIKNIAWDMLKGSGYSVQCESKAYYNSRVYTYVTVHDTIKK